MLDRICTQIAIKWTVFEQKHCSPSTKCPVNKLKVAPNNAQVKVKRAIKQDVIMTSL